MLPGAARRLEPASLYCEMRCSRPAREVLVEGRSPRVRARSSACDGALCACLSADDSAASSTVAVVNSASARASRIVLLQLTRQRPPAVAAERTARSPAVVAAVSRAGLTPRAFADFVEGERVVTLSPRFQDFDSRQLLAFEELEEGAAARRDVADLVLDAVLGDGRERVAAARNRERRPTWRSRQPASSCRCRTGRIRTRRPGRSTRSCRPFPVATASAFAVSGPMSRIMSSSCDVGDGLDFGLGGRAKTPWP